MVDPQGSAVAMVTDSTASLTSHQADCAGIAVVALQVILDGRSTAEGEPGATGADVAEALRAGRRVTTSRPTPEAFGQIYRELAERGASAAVSVHLSGKISGTYDAAILAARSAPIPVTVVDSETLAMGMGFAVLGGAKAALAGAGAGEIAEVVRSESSASSSFFSVDSLEYLRRGGRIGAAQALLGSALAVKPLLTVSDGVIQPYERVRTRAKAVARLAELGLEAGLAALGQGLALRLAVHHLDDADGAAELASLLAARLQEQGADNPAIVVAEISAVLGVHVGPGTLGVVVAPTSPGSPTPG
jgi:DegV family protein with EDD domain